MVKVDEIIGSLLLRHNCVIIPGFGGFVAKQASAQIDYKSGVISPPRKSLLFNRQLISNDGLLVSEFALRNQTSYDEALDSVRQMIGNWNVELSSGNRVSIDKVGFLFFDQERNICFEQDREFNLLLSSYGLGSVHFLTESDVAIAQHKIEVMEQSLITEEKPTLVVEIPEIKPIVAEQITHLSPAQPEEEKHIVVVPKKSNFWKYAAAACAIPVIFYSLWIPMKTDVLESKMISFQDFNPFHKQEQATYTQQSVEKKITKKGEQQQSLETQLEAVESNEDTYSYNLTNETYVLVNIEKKQEVENSVENTSQPTYTSAAGTMSYIVGCFSDEINAQNLVNDLRKKGFNASIKDRKAGLSRVSIGSANSQEELNQLMAKSTALGLTGWVLK